jgi:hypothetical protein
MLERAPCSRLMCSSAPRTMPYHLRSAYEYHGPIRQMSAMPRRCEYAYMSIKACLVPLNHDMHDSVEEGKRNHRAGTNSISSNHPTGDGPLHVQLQIALPNRCSPTTV